VSTLDVQAADAYCRALMRGHYENFVVASGLVHRALRADLARVYAFCRVTDDFGDESGSPAQALRRLEAWRADVCAMFEGHRPSHPVLVALGETLERHPMPSGLFLDLIAANVQDQRVSHYSDWRSLEAYCRLSAAPVGRMVLALFAIADPRAPSLSDDVCIGLQLANHAQDVKRDAALGRRYVPDDDVAAHGMHGAIAALVERARALLARGVELEPLAPLPLRLQLSFYRLGGLAICDAIERVGFCTDQRRPTVDGPAKAVVALRALRALGSQRSGHGRIETA
jgi:squalene synthase HpnC